MPKDKSLHSLPFHLAVQGPLLANLDFVCCPSSFFISGMGAIVNGLALWAFLPSRRP